MTVSRYGQGDTDRRVLARSALRRLQVVFVNERPVVRDVLSGFERVEKPVEGRRERGRRHVSATCRLYPLAEIRPHAPGVDPDEVAVALGYAVGSFDDDSVYHGRMDGTELSYEVVEVGVEVTLLVVSLGEVQPGRYAVVPEALVRTTPDRS